MTKKEMKVNNYVSIELSIVFRIEMKVKKKKYIYILSLIHISEPTRQS